MRAKTLSFINEQIFITNGIKAEYRGDEHLLALFAKKERVLHIAINAKSPPLLIYPAQGENKDTLHLDLVSLAPYGERALYATAECDTLKKALLFVDTYDDGVAERTSGEYTLPIEHDMRLPHRFVATKYGPAQFGLIVCAPDDPLLIRSSSGHLVKVKLIGDGKIVRIPCDSRDRALMDGMH